MGNAYGKLHIFIMPKNPQFKAIKEPIAPKVWNPQAMQPILFDNMKPFMHLYLTQMKYHNQPSNSKGLSVG